MNFLNTVSKGRRTLKAPAVPSEPSQVPPPWCAHCSCSLNKPITSKLLFWPQIILQREQRPRRGEGTPMPCPWPEQLPPSETRTARWVRELESPLAAPRKRNLNLRRPICFTPICTNLSPLCPWVKALAVPLPRGASPSDHEPNLQLTSGSALWGPRGRPHTGRYSSTEVSRCLTLVSGVIGTNRTQRLLRKLPCWAPSSCFLGNLITAWAGKEPGGTVKRDSLHLAY